MPTIEVADAELKPPVQMGLTHLPQSCHLIHGHFTDTYNCLAFSFSKDGKRQSKALVSLHCVCTRKVQNSFVALHMQAQQST